MEQSKHYLFEKNVFKCFDCSIENAFRRVHSVCFAWKLNVFETCVIINDHPVFLFCVYSSLTYYPIHMIFFLTLICPQKVFLTSYALHSNSFVFISYFYHFHLLYIYTLSIYIVQ